MRCFGGVGDAAIAGALYAEARQVIAVDLDDRKLELARGFGATHTLNAGSGDVVQHLKDLTKGFGPDVVIDAVGIPATYQQAFEARDLAGTVVLVGVPSPEARLDLPLIEYFGRGGQLKSSWYGDCLPLEAFVTERIGLKDVDEAFHRMEPGRSCGPSWSYNRVCCSVPTFASASRETSSRRPSLGRGAVPTALRH